MRDVTPIIPNTTMKEWSNLQGVPKIYYIYPEEGYALHDKTYDEPICDEYGNETGEILQKFTTLWTQVPVTYDFVTNPDELFTVPLSSINENQLMGDTTDNDHEVM